jgi:hypothetical protein
MLTLKRGSDPIVAPAPQQQYALVMLDAEQVSQLLGRPQMRRVNALPHAYDPHASYMRLRRRITAMVTAIAVACVGGALWKWAPRPAFAAVFPWSAPPTVATAASFSVAVTAPPSADAAARVASQIRGLALPVFTRRRPNTQAHQVLVGPYVSLDEAEAAQRFLRSRGFGAVRLFVDESVRNAPRTEYRMAKGGESPGVLLVGAPDRLSLVLELDEQPRRVSTKRVTDTTLEIDIGPMPNPIVEQEWAAPEGVHLVKSVAVEEVGGPGAGAGRFMRALVSLPEFSQASVRTDGPRVYVDLTWPQSGGDGEVAPPPRVQPAPVPEMVQAAAPAKSAAARSATPTGAAAMASYREQIAPSLDRIDEVTPFLLSASKTASPPVLAALTQTLKSLEASLASVSVPTEAADAHELMTAAARTARQSMDPTFTGDRGAQVQQAVRMFEGGRAALPAQQAKNR